MSFRLVPYSVTLDDLERRNRPYRSVILPKRVQRLRAVTDILDGYVLTLRGGL